MREIIVTPERDGDSAATWRPARHSRHVAALVRASGQATCINVDFHASGGAGGLARNRLAWWARLMRALLALILLRNLVYLYLQYDFDFKIVQLNRLLELQLLPPPPPLGHRPPPKLGGRRHFAWSEFELRLSGIIHALTARNCTDLNSCSAIELPSIDPTDFVARAFARSLAQLVEARAKLVRLGAPYQRAHFSIEVLLLAVMGLVVQVYFVTQLYFNHARLLQLGVLRVLLDPRAAQRELDASIARERHSYLASNANFLEICLQQPISQPDWRRATASEPSRERRPFNSSLQLLAHERRLVSERTTRMIARGELQPDNRKSEWLDALLRAFTIITVLCALGGIAIVLVFLLQVTSLVEPTSDGLAASLLAWLAHLEMLALMMVIVNSGGFYNLLVLFNCLDQIYATRRLKLSLRACLTANALKFGQLRELLDARASSRARDLKLNSLQIRLLSAQMNYNLLRAFLKYRLFHAQLKPIVKSYEFFAIQLIFLILWTPLMATLHASYTADQFKWLVFICSFSGAIFADGSLAPICHLYARCLDLYGLLSSLLAHALEVLDFSEREAGGWREQARACCCWKTREFADTLNGQRSRRAGQHGAHEQAECGSDELAIYDKHLVWLLYRELQYPDKMMDKFSVKHWGLRFTYTSLLKVHFWLGLINLTLLVGISPDQADRQHGIFGGLLNDPLGAFR